MIERRALNSLSFSRIARKFLKLRNHIGERHIGRHRRQSRAIRLYRRFKKEQREVLSYTKLSAARHSRGQSLYFFGGGSFIILQGINLLSVKASEAAVARRGVLRSVTCTPLSVAGEISSPCAKAHRARKNDFRRR